MRGQENRSQRKPADHNARRSADHDHGYIALAHEQKQLNSSNDQRSGEQEETEIDTVQAVIERCRRLEKTRGGAVQYSRHVSQHQRHHRHSQCHPFCILMVKVKKNKG